MDKLETDKSIKDPVMEIPGLNWNKMSLKEARQQKCFMQQEFERWLEKSDYLFHLRLTHFIPAPVSTWQEDNPGKNVSYKNILIRAIYGNY